MKIVMLVMNCIWYDPRVRKTASTAAIKYEVCAVGYNDDMYNSEKISELPFKTKIFNRDSKYMKSGQTFLTKVKREILTFNKMVQLCVSEAPDIIHANDLNALPIAYYAAKKTGAKVIYDSHEIYCENIGISGTKFRHLFWKTMENYLIRRVYKVLSVSNTSAAELTKIYHIDLPTVITNAYPAYNEQSLLPKHTDYFEVLIHGRFYNGRGYESFIDSAKILENESKIRLIIRGLGTTEAELHQRAKDIGVKDKNLFFDAPVTVNEMIKYASASHIGVAITEPINLNFKCSVSNKLFEYACAGLPVIMSDIPEHQYLNKKYNFGLILLDNTPSSIAEAITKLYYDNELYLKLKENAIAMTKVVNWENESARLFEIYENAIK